MFEVMLVVVGYVSGFVVCWFVKSVAIKKAQQLQTDAEAKLEELKKSAIDRLK